eukprot:COSAG02_NODE_659_length_18772_cov_14.955015_3_plen_205_part_00
MANGGKLQVDPAYFGHGGCTDAVQIARRVAHRQQRAPRAAGGTSPVKRLAEALFATTTTVGVLRMESPDNSRVSRSIDIQSDLKRALGHRALSTGSRAHSGAKRRKSSQSAVARWTSCSDSPCEAQTPPPPTNPGRPPRSRHTDASAESWCAALHQGVPCAQRQDVVVAHQPGGGDYLRINSLRRVERKCRLRWSGAIATPLIR